MLKTTKPISARSRMLRLVMMGGLLLLGGNAMLARYGTWQLRSQPLDLSVNMVRQSLSTSCGEAVIAMTYNYAYPHTPISEQQVIDYAAANGYYTPDVSPYTSPASMVKIARFYAEDISSGNVFVAEQGLALLRRYLSRGEPVVIDVLSNFQDPDSEAHFVVVTGISIDPLRDDALLIHYNDPLTGEFRMDAWDGQTGVWNAWKTNRDPGGSGWWLVIHGPK